MLSRVKVPRFNVYLDTFNLSGIFPTEEAERRAEKLIAQRVGILAMCSSAL